MKNNKNNIYLISTLIFICLILLGFVALFVLKNKVVHNNDEEKVTYSYYGRERMDNNYVYKINSKLTYNVIVKKVADKYQTSFVFYRKYNENKDGGIIQFNLIIRNDSTNKSYYIGSPDEENNLLELVCTKYLLYKDESIPIRKYKVYDNEFKLLFYIFWNNDMGFIGSFSKTCIFLMQDNSKIKDKGKIQAVSNYVLELIKQDTTAFKYNSHIVIIK